MKKNFFLYTLALAVSMPVVAQETYENAKLTGSELNGTARYVGMGGAMEALGADISTIAADVEIIVADISGMFPVEIISGGIVIVEFSVIRIWNDRVPVEVVSLVPSKSCIGTLWSLIADISPFAVLVYIKTAICLIA